MQAVPPPSTTSLHRILIGLQTMKTPSGVSGVSPLVSLAHRLLPIRDSQKVLAIAAHGLSTILQAKYTACILVNERGRPLRASVHNMDWDGQLEHIPVNPFLLSEAVRRRERQTVPHQDQSNLSAIEAQNTLIAQPVILNGKVIAVLFADATHIGPRISPTVIADLAILVDIVRMALGNAIHSDDQRLRGTLIAELAHDLRSPISVMLATSHHLQQAGTPRHEIREIAEDVETSLHHMTQIIGTGMEVARAQNLQPADPIRVHLEHTLPELIRPWSLLATQMHLALDMNIAPGLCTVTTIPSTLRVVLDNLVSNAFKNAPPGTRIAIHVVEGDCQIPNKTWARPSPDPSGMVRHSPLLARPDTRWIHVQVHNMGRPIPQRMRRGLFDPYTSNRRGYPTLRSTGLGMGIAAACAHQIGGAVWVAGSDQTGTRIHFSLPAVIVKVDPARTSV